METTTLLLSFGVLGIGFLGIAIGVFFGKDTVRGSCGGLATPNADGSCSVCGGDPQRCDGDGPQEKEHYSRLQQALQKNRNI
ncbi:MAG: (Na+)-NQR maturation NqrM [bacterium]|nr:(Na+)-NQR maturation NqrM [bacterium]